MKTTYLYALLAAYAFLMANAFAFTVSPRRLAMGEITLHGSLNTTCLPTRGGTAYLHLDIRTTGFPVEARSYRPKNIAVVLDRSGSMEQERKLEYAKEAVLRLVDGLSSADYLSLIVYDDRVATLIPRERVRDRERIRAIVRGIRPGGATNLGGGMTSGFRELEEFAQATTVNRVILLSDGRANKGVTNLPELERIARSYRARGISLTAMGVGLDFNEDLMMGIAGAGGGNYYFIESPRQLAAIFDEELAGVRSVAAQNAEVRLTPGRGVRVRDVVGYEFDTDGDDVVIPVGDLAANDAREFIVELDVPRGSGSLRVAAGTLRYAGCDGALPTFTADARYSDDVAELRRGINWEVQAKADVALSARQVDAAMKAYGEGRTAEAGEQLSAARRALTSSASVVNAPSMAPSIRLQERALMEFEASVADSGADRNQVKKSVEFENYKAKKRRP